MVGSFEWHVKAANLRQFLLAADPVLAGAGIELVVVGRVPGAVLDELRPQLRATQFAGWVERLADVLGDFVSRASARDDYAVVLNAAGDAVDVDATAALRGRRTPAKMFHRDAYLDAMN